MYLSLKMSLGSVVWSKKKTAKHSRIIHLVYNTHIRNQHTLIKIFLYCRYSCWSLTGCCSRSIISLALRFGQERERKKNKERERERHDRYRRTAWIYRRCLIYRRSVLLGFVYPENTHTYTRTSLRSPIRIGEREHPSVFETLADRAAPPQSDRPRYNWIYVSARSSALNEFQILL